MSAKVMLAEIQSFTRSHKFSITQLENKSLWPEEFSSKLYGHINTASVQQ